MAESLLGTVAITDGEDRMSIEPNERWYRITLRNGAQSCMVLALGRSVQDAERTLREEVPLYGVEIALIEAAGDRRVLAIG